MGSAPTPPPPQANPAAAANPGPPAGPDSTGKPANASVPLKGKTAVFEAMAENSAVKALADLATDAKFDRGELTVTVGRESILAACEAVKSAGFVFFEDVTAVDWYPQEPRFQLSYHILSMKLKQRVRLVVQLDSTDAVVPSITPAWPSANFYEREVFDLFGIHFTGHPGLTRIMMPTDWQGHPLRKDYPVEGYR